MQVLEKDDDSQVIPTQTNTGQWAMACMYLPRTYKHVSYQALQHQWIANAFLACSWVDQSWSQTLPGIGYLLAGFYILPSNLGLYKYLEYLDKLPARISKLKPNEKGYMHRSTLGSAGIRSTDTSTGWWDPPGHATMAGYCTILSEAWLVGRGSEHMAAHGLTFITTSMLLAPTTNG